MPGALGNVDEAKHRPNLLVKGFKYAFAGYDEITLRNLYHKPKWEWLEGMYDGMVDVAPLKG